MKEFSKQRFFYCTPIWLTAFLITMLGLLLVSPTQAAMGRNVAAPQSVNVTPILSGSVSDGTVVNNHDLSGEGHEDWAVWGEGTNTSLIPDARKNGGSAISNLTNLTNGTPLRGLGQFGDFSHTFNWSNGTPTAAATSATLGIQHYTNNAVQAIGEGFGFTLPADTTLRRARIYVGTHNGQSKVIAALSDASAANFVAFQTGISNNRPAIIELIYAAATAGQTLDVEWTLSQANDNAANAQLFAVTITKDSDSDTIFDDIDNCPTVVNTNQANFDNDAQGDACDSDDDNDGVSDTTETTNGTNPLDADSDDDTVNDGQDAFPNDSNESTDTDGDTIGNNADIDDDNDNVSDTDEATNGSDPLDSDSDDDLVPDGADSVPTQKPTITGHERQNTVQSRAAQLASPDVELNLHGQSSFVVPVLFTPNGPNVASIDFVLDYDESCLTFATAGNNGVPAAVSGLPATHVTTVQPDTAAGKLTFLIHPPSNTPPLPLLNNVGTLAQITFGVRNECVTTDGATQTATFAFPDVDYGYADGSGLPNQTGQTSTYLLRFNAAPTAISLVDSNNAPDNTIDENAAVGTVVASLNSADVDETAPRPGDTHSYSLVSGAGSDDNNAFTLSGDQLKAALSFDFEAKNSYAIRVRSTDQYGLSFEQALTVLVNDVNEAPTALDLDDNTVAEHVAGDVVGLLTTDDQDLINPGGAGDILEVHGYTLPAGQGDNDLFEIVGNSLQFKPANSANFEVKNSYSVVVRSSDSANQVIESTFALVVLDRDDNPVAKDDGVNPPLVVVGGSTTVIDVLGNDSDEDGDPLSVIAVGAPSFAGASTAFNPASVSYAGPNQNGQDSFTYTISDGSAPTAEGNVTVQVVKNDPRGDCNSDGTVNAADFPSLVLEYFDQNSTDPWWDIFRNGFAGSPRGCDANANGPTGVEVSGGAGDIICTVLIFFNRGCAATEVSLNAASQSAAAATLAVATDLQSAPGQTVAVPLQLGTGGNTIAAATFALSFDAAHFTFDPTDSNDDGLPEAVTLNVPASMVKSVSYNAALSRVEVAVFGASLPLPTLKDGVLATVSLQVQNSITVSPAPVNLALVSLGTDNGQTVAVTVTHGTVLIDGVRSTGGVSVFMPAIQK